MWRNVVKSVGNYHTQEHWNAKFSTNNKEREREITGNGVTHDLIRNLQHGYLYHHLFTGFHSTPANVPLYTRKKTTVSYVCFSKMLIIYDQFIYTFCTEKNPNRKKTVENSGRVFIYVLKLGAVFIGPLVMGSYFCNEFAIICQKMSN